MRTRTQSLLLSGILAMLVGLVASGPVLAASTTLVADLKGGAAETPAGDPNGSGSAVITIDLVTRKICWMIAVVNIAAATASHIHLGGAGVNLGVFLPLDVDGFIGSTAGCATAGGADLAAILDNPAGFFVDVHTTDFPGGAIRGQLGFAVPNTAVATPEGSPLVPLGLALVFIGLGGALRVVGRRIRPPLRGH